jgi:hypothetical protein
MATALQSKSEVGVIDSFRWCILGGDSPIYLPGFVLGLGHRILRLARHHPISQNGKDFRRSDLTFRMVAAEAWSLAPEEVQASISIRFSPGLHLCRSEGCCRLD